MIKHLACIMDGNRRWAQRQGLPPSLGHREGIKAVERTADFCLKHKIPYLTLYTFSIENLKRSLEEKQYIFGLLIDYFKEQTLQKLIEQDIRVQFIGDKSLFSENVLKVCVEIEKKTANHKTLTIYFLFCYGGRQEITAAVKRIASAALQNNLSLDNITEKTVFDNLWLSGIPEPELIIRTGGVQRLSNFLLFQAAYSELYFTNTLWPDITDTHLLDAFAYLNSCKRNFGI